MERQKTIGGIAECLENAVDEIAKSRQLRTTALNRSVTIRSPQPHERCHHFRLVKGDIYCRPGSQQVQLLVNLAEQQWCELFGEHLDLLALVTRRADLEKFLVGNVHVLVWIWRGDIPDDDSEEKWISVRQWLKEQALKEKGEQQKS